MKPTMLDPEGAHLIGQPILDALAGITPQPSEAPFYSSVTGAALVTGSSLVPVMLMVSVVVDVPS